MERIKISPCARKELKTRREVTTYEMAQYGDEKDVDGGDSRRM